MEGGGGGEAKPSPNPKPSPPPPRSEAKQRDFLLHVESYLARRDGVDKLLKIARYVAKIALASHAPLPGDLAPRLKVFESSVGLSRKAFRLGKFVQDVNALRAATSAVSPSSVDVLLATLAYGGEGLYYFVEQLVWLSKAGLLGPHRARQFQQLSAWAELVGYVGSIALKAREIAGISAAIESKATKSTGGGDGVDREIRKLREKLVMKRLSVVQDVADGLMALADVRGGKGLLTDPLLMASAGLLSALISAHKNWASC